MQTMTDDRFDPIESAHGDGSWRALIGAAGVAVRGVATAFNPFIAAAVFVASLAAGAFLLAGIDVAPVWVRFVGVILGSTAIAYVAGKIGNALVALLVVGLVCAAIAGVGYGLWIALS